MRLPLRSDFAERGTADTRRAKPRRFVKVPREWRCDPLLCNRVPREVLCELVRCLGWTFTDGRGRKIGLPLNPTRRRTRATVAEEKGLQALVRRTLWTRDALAELVGAHKKHIQKVLHALADPERRKAGLPSLWLSQRSRGLLILVDAPEVLWNRLAGKTLLARGDPHFDRWLQVLPEIKQALGLLDYPGLHGDSEAARGSIDAPPWAPTGSVDAPLPDAKGNLGAPSHQMATSGLAGQARSVHGQTARGLSPGRDKQNESERKRGVLSQPQLRRRAESTPSHIAPFRHQSDDLRRIAEASGLLKQMESDRATEQELARKQESAESDDGEHYRNSARRARDLK